nr:putative zinc finger, CCHC-type [Tanacetum cinerariifolium]
MFPITKDPSCSYSQEYEQEFQALTAFEHLDGRIKHDWKIKISMTIGPTGHANTISLAEATLDWQSENVVAQNKVLVKILSPQSSKDVSEIALGTAHAREEFLKMKCCSFQKKDLEKHYDRMSQRFYCLNRVDDVNLKQVFLNSFIKYLGNEAYQALEARNVPIAQTTLGELYQLILNALAKLCKKIKFLDEFERTRKCLEIACDDKYLQIKCKDKSSCDCTHTKKKFHSKRYSSLSGKPWFSRQSSKKWKFIRKKKKHGKISDSRTKHDWKIKILMTIGPTGHANTISPAEATLDWQSENVVAQNKVLVKILSPQKNVESTIQFDAEEYEEHQENPNQKTPTEFPKSDIRQYFTFDDVPPSKWRERSIEMQTWCTVELQYYTIDVVIKRFLTRLQGRLRDWYHSLALGTAHAREEFLKMKCCSFQKKDLEKHYDRMSQRFYCLNRVDVVNLKQVFLNSFIKSLGNEAYQVLEARNVLIAQTTLGELYQLILNALAKLCKKIKFLAEFERTRKRLGIACDDKYLQIKCK